MSNEMLLRIRRLENERTELTGALNYLRGVVADWRAQNLRLRSWLAEQPSGVEATLGLLDRRVVSSPDRARLRDALERAEKPLAGRAGQDEALRRITRLQEARSDQLR
jgi:hypothetical protein